jgi:fructokinase
MSSDAQPAFIVVGEALIDLGASAAADGSYLARPGGSPLNVSVGLARLGQPVAFAGRLSDDPFGTILRRHLGRSGVDLGYVVSAREPSTIALVEITDGHARYQFTTGGADFQWTADELAFLPAGASALHFGSLTSWLPPGDSAVAAAVARIGRRGPVLVSYDPNIRPALQPDVRAARHQVESAVQFANVVKASLDDVRYLYPGREPDSVARTWLDLGAALVIVTAGAEGATGWLLRGPVVRRPASPGPVADTVGAGDAYTSGLLDALARRDLLAPAALAASLDAVVLTEVMDAAAVVAGITCSRPGADPPWRHEIVRARPPR